MTTPRGNGIPAAAIAAAFAGAVFVWSGVKGKSISTTLRSLLAGQNPSGDPQSTSIDAANQVVTPDNSAHTQVQSGIELPPGQKQAAIVQYAAAQLGKPYVFATSGPNTFDCSGLVAAAYRAVGISIPHNSLLQWNTCTRITEDQLQEGDIIFYYPTVHHCALYVGNGQLIEASEPGVPIHQIPVYNNAQNPIKGYGRY